jgi:hypothetical protein
LKSYPGSSPARDLWFTLFIQEVLATFSELSKKVDPQIHTTRTYTTGLYKSHQIPSTDVHSKDYTISSAYLHFQIIFFRPELNLTDLNVDPSIARDAKYVDVIDTNYPFTGDVHIAETMLTFSSSS